MKLTGILRIAMTTSIVIAGIHMNIAHAEASFDPSAASIGGMAEAVNEYYEDRLSESGISVANITTPIVVDGERLTAIARASVYDDKAFSNTEDYVKIRSSWSTDSEVVGKLYRGHAVTVLNVGTHWTKIHSGNVTGYIANEYLIYGQKGAQIFEDNYITKKIKVTCTTLNVRMEMDKTAKIQKQIGIDDKYTIIEEYDDWFKIRLDSDTTGYVHKDYVDVVYYYKRAISIEEEQAQIAAQRAEEEKKQSLSSGNKKPSGSSNSSGNSNHSSSSSSGSSNSGSSSTGNSNSSKGQQIAAYAKQFIGNPYVWGGTSLTNGADCSGFVLAIYQHFGYTLPRTSKEQARSAGKKVTASTSNLQAGDLIFYGTSGGTVNHVAMYIGNGQVVHASNKKDGIKINSWNYRPPICARRIL